MGIFDFLFKREKNKEIRKVMVIADKVEALGDKYAAYTDEELRGCTAEFKDRLAAGETLDDLLPEAFAVVREASTRVLNMRHYYVQIIGGIVLHQGRIAEMKTGEGKTLVETLPAYLNALKGEGVHVVTVNDYLAKRDAEWMGKVFSFLGMTVGVSLSGMKSPEKRSAYACDITYCTNNEIGFDYLRDNMAKLKSHKVLRGLNYVIIDEIDSILIDEARTPLIISGHSNQNSDVYRTVARFMRDLTEEDYEIDVKDKQISLTEEGVSKAETFFKVDNLGDIDNADLYAKIHMGLRAHFLMQRDKDYIISKGQVMIVDEFTGRVLAMRRYSDGLHQSIEAKEGVVVKNENITIATITYQNLFRLYKKISGMTGTAMTEEAEFKGIYSLDVVEIPTNKDMVRVDEPDKIYFDKEAKYKAIIKDIMATHETGQPILVGTVDVDVSEYISKILKGRHVPHNVLNAKNHRDEAGVIAQAGKLGAITIATNMAGRGTDILLGGNPEYLAKDKMRKRKFSDEMIEIASAYNKLTDPAEIKARETFVALKEEFSKVTEEEKAKVKELGGLRVIGVARHESRRIDNQLRGRSGRQGDPGTSCFYLSFEDDLLKRFGGQKLSTIVENMGQNDEFEIQLPIVSKIVEMSQKRCEETNYTRRRYVLNYDDVMNKQRELIYAQRDEVLDGIDVHEQIRGFFEDVVDEVMDGYRDFTEEEETDAAIADFNKRLSGTVLPVGMQFLTEEMCLKYDRNEIRDMILEKARNDYEERCKDMEEKGIDYKQLERITLLKTVDDAWVLHIDQMDALREGISLRSYAGRDPVTEYRREGMEMFDDMIDSIRKKVVRCAATFKVKEEKC